LGEHGKPKTGDCYESCDNTFVDKQYNYHTSMSCIEVM
jgi:hypothetical protein